MKHLLLNKKIFLMFFLAGMFFNVLVFQYKTEMTLFVWHTFHTLPEVMLFTNADATIAVEIGNYYFNVYENGVYDLEKAQRYFEHALLLDPLIPDAWHQLSRIDFLNGDFDSALYKINKQIEIHGDSFMASYYIRGLIYGYMDEFKKAEENFLVFLEWDPINWATHNDLAWVYFQGGRYEKALEIAHKGLSISPANVWLLNMKGLALLNLGHLNEAREFFEQALSGTVFLTKDSWHRAYPGNDPGIAGQGLREMREAIEKNISLVSVYN